MNEEQLLQLQSKLITGSELTKELRLRKQEYNYETVSKRHQSYIDEKIEQGWEVDKELKESVKLRKLKSIDVLCEDHVWALLCQMGFTVMNKDRQLKIPYDIENNLTQQIDVLAKDDDTILLVECKTTRTNKIGDFKKELEAVAGRYEGIIKTLHKLFPDKKYKIKFILATMNFGISAPDKIRIDNLGGYHMDEESLAYYSELHKQLGQASRYQFLASLFRGQEIPGLQNLVPAVRGKMGGHTYYSFSVEPEKILKIGYVLHRNKANSEMMPTYQRIIKKGRLNQVREFIEDKGGFFPNSIVLNIDTEGRGLTFDLANTQTDSKLTSIGILHLPKKYQSAYIIDGQHRLYGYTETDFRYKNSIPVVAFVDLGRGEQVKMFMEINENQKAVPKNLRTTLKADLLWTSDKFSEQFEALRSRVAITLGDRRNSPLFDLISVGEDRKKITTDPIIKSLKDGNLIGTANKYNIEKFGAFYKGNLDEAFQNITEYIRLSLAHLKEQSPYEWDRDDSLITSNRGIYAVLRILSDIVDHLYTEGHIVETSSVKDIYMEAKRYINALANSFNNITSEKRAELNFKLGQGAFIYFWRNYQRAIREEIPKFQPVGLDDFEIKENKEYNDEAYSLISDIEKMLKINVRKYLEDFYGDTWFEEGVPPQIQDDATLEAQRKKRESGGKKTIEAWDCLKLINYKNIAIRQGNWQNIFEDKFTLPEETKRGNKESKTSWLNNLNTIRNQVMHEYYVSKEDLEFVQKIHNFLCK